MTSGSKAEDRPTDGLRPPEANKRRQPCRPWSTAASMNDKAAGPRRCYKRTVSSNTYVAAPNGGEARGGRGSMVFRLQLRWTALPEPAFCRANLGTGPRHRQSGQRNGAPGAETENRREGGHGPENRQQVTPACARSIQQEAGEGTSELSGSTERAADGMAPWEETETATRSNGLRAARGHM